MASNSSPVVSTPNDSSRLFARAETAAAYATHRPTYPPHLFEMVHAYTRRHGAAPSATEAIALDVACGSGQAGVGVSHFYTSVIGVDVSPAQVAAGQAAPPAANMTFAVGDASALPRPDASVDLVLCGEALHWFDIPAFYGEAARVLRPSSTIAILGYGGSSITDHPAADAAFQSVWRDLLATSWDPRVPLILEALYAGYEPPESLFHSVERHVGRTSGMVMERAMGVDAIVGFCDSWSGTATYRSARGIGRGDPTDPSTLMRERLEAALPARGLTVTMTWPLVLMLGTKRG